MQIELEKRNEKKKIEIVILQDLDRILGFPTISVNIQGVLIGLPSRVGSHRPDPYG